MIRVNQIYIGALLMAIPMTIMWAVIVVGYFSEKQRDKWIHFIFWGCTSFVAGFYIVFLSLL